MKIIDAIKQVVKSMLKEQSFRAKVLSVDKTNDTCDVEPIRGGAKYLDVKLKSVINPTDSKILVYPKVGSVITVSIVDNNTADVFVSQYSEFESILIENKKSKVLIPETGNIEIAFEKLTLNDGLEGGLIKINELKTQLDKNTKVLKQIQTVFKNWAVTPNDGGAVLKGLSTSFSSLPTALLNNIENKKITHG